MARIVSEKHNIPVRVVLHAYLSFYDKIKSTIESLELNDNPTEEYINNSVTSFNIKHLGKLYTSNYIVGKINENRLIKNENIKHKESSTNA